MIIPKEKDLRIEFYRDVLQKCTATRAARREIYRLLKTYYLFGVRGQEDETRARFNKIFPHIDQLISFMYDRAGLRFNIEIGPSVNRDELYKIPPLNDALSKEWKSSGASVVFGHCLEWAYVYGSMFVKPRWKNGSLQHFSVEPHNFGVFREDTIGIDNQEAFSHSYYITESQLRSELVAGSHARVDEILVNAQAARREEVGATVGPVDQIIISAVSPDIRGNVQLWNWDLFGMYRAKVSQPLIEMHELYVFDDDIGDYQLVTVMNNMEEVIWDRPLERIFLKDEPPFVQVCPSPLYDYFWGGSEVERLINLQDLRNERIAQIRHMLGLQANPPKSATGFAGPIDEMVATLDSPGGVLANDQPVGSVNVHSPDVPEDLWTDVREIDMMFEEISGISNVMQGRGESGVRSTGHASQLARLGGARAKRRANTVEDQCDKLATLDLRIMQRYDKRKYREDREGGVEFIAEQFTKDSIVVVDAHSNSPLFTEDQDAKALELFKARAIDREELLRLLSVPMRELLIQKLKTKIEPAEAKAAAEERQLKLMQGGGKGKG